MVHGLAPVLLSIILIALFHTLLFRSLTVFVVRFIFTGFITFALCAMKLLPALIYLKGFARTDYSLSGVSNIVQLLRMAAASLLGIVNLYEAQAGLSNSQWQLAHAEFLYDVGFLPILIIGLSAIMALLQRRVVRTSGLSLMMAGAIFLLLITPIALNYYNPNWNGLLKSLPLFGNSVTILRWFVIYIPVVISLCVNLSLGTN